MDDALLSTWWPQYLKLRVPARRKMETAMREIDAVVITSRFESVPQGVKQGFAVRYEFAGGLFKPDVRAEPLPYPLRRITGAMADKGPAAPLRSFFHIPRRL